VYGGSEVPLTTPTYSYARTVLSGENLRAFKTSQIAIGNITLGTDKNNQMGMTIENVLPGMLYKTSNISMAEGIRTRIAEIINSDDITFEMSGPMVNTILLEGQDCTEIASKLGNLTLTAKTGGDVMNINISTFLRQSGPNCRLYLSILVFSGQDDQLVLG
jgi:hypothetical protein